MFDFILHKVIDKIIKNVKLSNYKDANSTFYYIFHYNLEMSFNFSHSFAKRTFR